MALVVADRVKETTATTGTGDVALGGAPVNFVTFSSELSDGDTTYYAIVDNNNGGFEVGIGTYSSGANSLSRDTVLESSNSGAKVNLQSGAKDVFVTYPAGKAVYLDGDGKIAGNQTFFGTVTLNADPALGLQAATKQYVDGIAAVGIQYHEPVRVEREGNLTATYDNGTSGVGATLTNSGTQEALVIDSVTMVVDDRVLVYEQTDATENGVYTVTNVGSGSTNWVLTRATDADSYAPSDPQALAQGAGFFVEEGTAGAGETYVCNTVGTITFGTTDITFAQVSSAQVYTGGTGINITGSVISSDATLQEVTANGATTTADVTFGNVTANTLVSNSITYPASDGTAGQFLKTDGAGTLSFATASVPTLDAVTGAGNNTANSITVGDINASAITANSASFSGNITTTGRGVAGTNTASITGSTTLDFSADQNFVLTMTGDVTLANPTTEAVGQSGFITFIQDGNGGRTLSLGSQFKTANGAGITLSSAADAEDIVPYAVTEDGRIFLGAPQLDFS